MGRPSRKGDKRKKSSGSDSEKKTKKKHIKYGGKAQCGRRIDYDVSDIIGNANGILYDSDYTYNTYGILCENDDSDCDLNSTTDINPVFTPLKVNTGNHTNTQDNMASGHTPSVAKGASGNLDSNQFTILMGMMTDLKKGQDDMTKMFDSKLEKFKCELLKNIDDQVTQLRTEISNDVQRQGTRIDEVMTTIQSLKDRVDTIEQSGSANAQGSGDENMDTGNGNVEQGQRTFRPAAHSDDTEMSVIVSGLPYIHGEDLMQKAQDLVNALGNDVTHNVNITNTVRYRTRYLDRPGPVKVTFRTVQEKVAVLRNKMQLKNIEEYQEVYVKSCKSHAERLIEINARTLLRQMPNGRDFRVDANGRIQRRERQDNQQGGH